MKGETMPKMDLYKVRIYKETKETINLPFIMDDKRRAKERSEAAARHGVPLHYVRIHRAKLRTDRRKLNNNLKGVNRWKMD